MITVLFSWTLNHDRRIAWMVCPDCKRRAPFVQCFQEWYGWSSTCLRCGRHWEDGEWCPLPFMRGAREASKDAARRRWRRGISPSCNDNDR
jgi:hypothetical protein